MAAVDWGEIWKEALVYVPVVLAFVSTGSAAAVAVLPQGKPGTGLFKVRTVLNWLAINVGNAKNFYQYRELLPPGAPPTPTAPPGPKA